MHGGQNGALVRARPVALDRRAIGAIREARRLAHEGELLGRFGHPQLRNEPRGLDELRKAVERRGEPQPVEMGQAIAVVLDAEPPRAPRSSSMARNPRRDSAAAPSFQMRMSAISEVCCA